MWRAGRTRQRAGTLPLTGKLRDDGVDDRDRENTLIAIVIVKITGVARLAGVMSVVIVPGTEIVLVAIVTKMIRTHLRLLTTAKGARERRRVLLKESDRRSWRSGGQKLEQKSRL